MLQQLPGHGGGTTKRDRLSWINGAVFRIVYGRLTPTDADLPVCGLAVELELSGTSRPKGLMRVVLVRAGVARGGNLALPPGGWQPGGWMHICNIWMSRLAFYLFLLIVPFYFPWRLISQIVLMSKGVLPAAL